MRRTVTEFERLQQMWTRGDGTVSPQLCRLAIRYGDMNLVREVAPAALSQGDTAAIGFALEAARTHPCGFSHPTNLILRAFYLAWRTKHRLLGECARELVESTRAVLQMSGSPSRKRPMIGALRALRLSYETARLLGDVTTAVRAILALDNGYHFLHYTLRRNPELPVDDGDGATPTPGDVVHPSITALTVALAERGGSATSYHEHDLIANRAVYLESGFRRLGDRSEEQRTRAQEREYCLNLLLREPNQDWVIRDGKTVRINDAYFVLPALVPPTSTHPMILRRPGWESQFTRAALPLVRRMLPSLIARDIVSVQPMTSPSASLFGLDFARVQQEPSPGANARSVIARWANALIPSNMTDGERRAAAALGMRTMVTRLIENQM